MMHIMRRRIWSALPADGAIAVFSAQPHFELARQLEGLESQWADPAGIADRVTLIDLSGDFRLSDGLLFEAAYGKAMRRSGAFLRRTATNRENPMTRSLLPLPALLATAAAAVLAATALPATAGPGHAHDARAEAAAERATERQRQDLYKAWFPDLATARKAAISLHGRLLETEYERGWQIFELDGEHAAILQRFGYRLEPATEFIARRNAFLDSIDAANARRRSADASAADVGVQAIPGYACYETVEETLAAAQGMVAARPQLAALVDIGDSWQKSTNRGGYDMAVLRLTNAATTGTGGAPKPKLFITSAIHAREYVTAPLSLAFAKWLFDGHGVNADATWLLDHHEVHLLLQTNPDGRKKAEAGPVVAQEHQHRLLRRTQQQPRRRPQPQLHVQLEQHQRPGLQRQPVRPDLPRPQRRERTRDAGRRGLHPQPLARPPRPGQTDAAPADTSGIHLDLHSYSELVLWPWGDTPTAAPNGAALQTLGRRFAWFNDYTPTQSIGLYPTDGTSDGPGYGELGVAAYTFELGTSFFQNCTSYENTIKPRNLQALVYAAKVARAPYQLPGGPDVTALSLSAAVVDAGTPVTLTASVTDTRFNQSNGAEPVQAIAAVQAFVDVPPWADGRHAAGAGRRPTAASTAAPKAPPACSTRRHWPPAGTPCSCAASTPAARPAR